MTVEEILDKGLDAFGEDRYEEALSLFWSIADKDASAQGYIPFSYLNLGEEISLQASSSGDQESLIRGQQKAMSLWDAAVRLGLNFIKSHPEETYLCSVNAGVIAMALSSQYAIAATGLTTAYSITRTTTTINRHMLGNNVFWDEIVGTETEKYLSLYSGDMRDFHIFGPDERTKRIAGEKEKICHNTAQVASILTWLGREYDAYMVRAAVAEEMADCENGEKSMLLAGEWFITRGRELARSAMNGEDYKEWQGAHEPTTVGFRQTMEKYAALVRKMKKKGANPPLHRLYQQGETIPTEEFSAFSSQTKATAEDKTEKWDWWEVFLTVFSQLTFMRVLPTIMFSSVMSIFMGGMINLFNPSSDTYAPVFGGIWLAITFILTMVRLYKNSDNIDRTNFGLYKVLMYALIPLFGIKFWVGLVIFLVLRFLSKKYE